MYRKSTWPYYDRASPDFVRMLMLSAVGNTLAHPRSMTAQMQPQEGGTTASHSKKGQ